MYAGEDRSQRELGLACDFLVGEPAVNAERDHFPGAPGESGEKAAGVGRGKAGRSRGGGVGDRLQRNLLPALAEVVVREIAGHPEKPGFQGTAEESGGGTSDEAKKGFLAQVLGEFLVPGVGSEEGDEGPFVAGEEGFKGGPVVLGADRAKEIFFPGRVGSISGNGDRKPEGGEVGSARRHR